MAQGKFIGIGGEAFTASIRDATGANPPYDDRGKDARDGIYMLPFKTVSHHVALPKYDARARQRVSTHTRARAAQVESALSGEWRECCHGSWKEQNRHRAPRILDEHHEVCIGKELHAGPVFAPSIRVGSLCLPRQHISSVPP